MDIETFVSEVEQSLWNMSWQVLTNFGLSLIELCIAAVGGELGCFPEFVAEL